MAATEISRTPARWPSFVLFLGLCAAVAIAAVSLFPRATPVTPRLLAASPQATSEASAVTQTDQPTTENTEEASSDEAAEEEAATDPSEPQTFEPGPLDLPTNELEGPPAKDRHVALVVSELLSKDHLLKESLDDTHSQRGLDNFFRSLDPMKVYFLQPDIEEFTNQRNNLDDQIKSGDVSFAYQLFNRFLKRVNERVSKVDAFLMMEHDYSLDEEIVRDPDSAVYATDETEADKRWKKRIKYDLLVLKADEEDPIEARNRLSRRYRSFAKRMHQTDSDELLEMFLTAFTTGFDPHTTYMSASSLENFHIMMRLNLEGIGAALHVVDGYTVVSKVIPGGAADKHGMLEPEDRIISVGEGKDGEGEMIDVVDMKLKDVVKKIRGRAGEIVRLGVNSAGSSETKIYEITRAKIELTDSEAKHEIIEDGQKPGGQAFRVGYIDLPSFYMDMTQARLGAEDYKSTTRDVQKILTEFTAKNVDVVMLDLRRNGGGSLTEAINLTGLFIDRGPVVQVKDSADRIQRYDDNEAGSAWNGPLVVLTSKFSASASEILAGAVQDYHRGLIIGDTSTHGKGTVQSLLDLGSHFFRGLRKPPNLGALKITMQQFYRPNGDSTQKRGVLSDIVLPSLTDHMDVAESDLDFAIDFDQVPAAEYTATNMVNPNIIEVLKQRSTARSLKDDKFKELNTNIERYVEFKERKTLTINEEKYMARRAELDAEKEEEKQFEKQQDGGDDDEVVERTFYFNEMLSVTIDYMNLLYDHQIVRN